MSIGENVKKLREKRGLSQRDVSNKLFISVQMLSGIETGIRQPSLNIALALAKFFGTTVEALAGLTTKESEAE